jgi:hypothetical protein
VSAEVFNERDADGVGNVVVTFTQTKIDEGQQPGRDRWLPLVEGAHGHPQEVTHEQVQKELAIVGQVLSHQVIRLRDRPLQLINKAGSSDHMSSMPLQRDR